MTLQNGQVQSSGAAKEEQSRGENVTGWVWPHGGTPGGGGGDGDTSFVKGIETVSIRSSAPNVLMVSVVFRMAPGLSLLEG